MENQILKMQRSALKTKDFDYKPIKLINKEYDQRLAEEQYSKKQKLNFRSRQLAAQNAFDNEEAHPKTQYRLQAL